MPPLAPHAVSPDGWVAFVQDERRSVGLLHLDAELHEQRFAPLTLPDGFTAHCLAFDGARLIVGGERTDEMLGLFDLGEGRPRWVPTEGPDDLCQAGKAIDAILVDGDRVIADDDIEGPKHLLLYDRPVSRDPADRETRMLATHDVYETVLTAAMNARTMAILSCSGSSAGSLSHVALLNGRTLTEFGALVDASDLRQHVWSDVAWSGERLLIAA